MSEVVKLLNEFNVKMNDDYEEEWLDPEEGEDDDDDEFDFNFNDKSPFDELDFDNDGERGESDGDFSDMGMADHEDDSDSDSDFDEDGFEPEDDFPAGLGDVEDDDGEFNGERKVDITQRLQQMLAKRGEDEVESPDMDLDFDLKSLGRR